MIVTDKILESIGASREEIELFIKICGTETTIGKLIERGDAISFALLNRLYNSLIYYEYKEALEEELKINNSKNILYSHHITNCEDVVDSNFCTNSARVKYSTQVYDSLDVIGSRDISHSNMITFSEDVKVSEKIYDSRQVLESFVVKKSKKVTRSSFTFFSEDVRDSFLLYNSEKVRSSHFSRGLVGVSNKLFCTNAVNGQREKFMIFNQEVSKNTFIHSVETLESLRPRFEEDSPDQLLDRTNVLSIFISEFNRFMTLTPRLKEMLPLFDEDVLKEITFSL